MQHSLHNEKQILNELHIKYYKMSTGIKKAINILITQHQ